MDSETSALFSQERTNSPFVAAVVLENMSDKFDQHFHSLILTRFNRYLTCASHRFSDTIPDKHRSASYIRIMSHHHCCYLLNICCVEGLESGGFSFGSIISYRCQNQFTHFFFCKYEMRLAEYSA